MIKKLIILSILSFLLVIPASAQIPTSPLQPELQEEIFGFGQAAAVASIGESALSEVDIRFFAIRFVRGALMFVGLIFLIMILYGGALWMFSGGEQEKVGKAKKIFTNSTIGVLVILMAYIITATINSIMFRAVQQSTLRQAQNCNTTNGVSACCQEWAAYDTARGRISSAAELGDVARGWGALITGGNPPEDQEADAAYHRWQDCWENATENAGLDDNWFD